MKKLIALLMVLVAITVFSVSFRDGLGKSRASRREPARERPDAIEGASLSLVPVGLVSDDEKSDLAFARAAASTGDRLLDRARQSPGNPHLFRQAAAHYRAALAHEPTARDGGELFAAVREKLVGLDREVARCDRPGVAKPTTTLPHAIVKGPMPTAKPAKPAPITAPPVVLPPELIMVGPDGVEIRRAGPGE